MARGQAALSGHAFSQPAVVGRRASSQKTAKIGQGSSATGIVMLPAPPSSAMTMDQEQREPLPLPGPPLTLTADQ